MKQRAPHCELLSTKNSRSREIVRFILCGALFFSIALSTSCSSIPFVKQSRAYTRIFLVDYSTAWTAAMEAVSGGKDLIKNHNRETGTINTNWVDTTEFRQILDMFTDEDFFLRSRVRLEVQMREGKKNDQNAVLVRVLKQQQRETTFMGGWQDYESDGLEEAVALYRIGRLIAIQQKMDETDFKQGQLIESDAISFD